MADDYGDVVYETWRRGGNVDRLDRDEVLDDLRHGDYASEIAEREIGRQTRAQRRLEHGREDTHE